MQPNQQPDPTPAPVPAGAPPVATPADPVVEFFRTDRSSAGTVLLVVGGILLALCAWLTVKANRAPAGEPEKETEQEKMRNPFEADEEKATKPRDPNRTDYISGAILAAAACLTFLSAGAFLMAGQPRPSEAEQRAEARGLILAVGGVFGALLIVGGIWFFYQWSSSLTDWLDKDQTRQAKWVLIPLMAVAAGAAVMFLAVMPARAEERNNSLLRRLVYGTNTGLGVLLLFVFLVVANVVVRPRVPNKLDTTEQGFYSLSDGGRSYLSQLPDVATAYVILQEGRRDASDIRRLLENCRDASGGKFTIQTVNISNQAEYRALVGRYPVLEANDLGVLLTVGEDGRRHSFIREDEFFQRDQQPMMDPRAQSGPRAFIGEARLLKELQYLLEDEQKAVVYFTQSAGELDITGGGQEGVNRTRSAVRLKEYLERNYLTVKPLRFDLEKPEVPADAAVVVVAHPLRPLDEKHVAALHRYMNEPRAGGKKGKLIVLAGAAFGPPPNRDVARTGLEGLLAEFNVALEPRYIMSTGGREFPPGVCIAEFTRASRDARNPVAMALGEKIQFLSIGWREVGVNRPGNPMYRAVPLLQVMDGQITWLEDHEVSGTELNRVLDELGKNRAVRAAKRFTDEPRPVGVAVSDAMGGEGGGRVVVLGNGLLVNDMAVQEAGGDPPGANLVSGSIDWLRDRPPLTISVKPKEYVEFRFPAKTDTARGKYLPLLLSLTIVTGLGVSIWAVRRRTK